QSQGGRALNEHLFNQRRSRARRAWGARAQPPPSASLRHDGAAVRYQQAGYVAVPGYGNPAVRRPVRRLRTDAAPLSAGIRGSARAPEAAGLRTALSALWRAQYHRAAGFQLDHGDGRQRGSDQPEAEDGALSG